MKLLIIAGPYEADRLRKAAVSAGFEAVAVEPGESLSGWITASRPALIVMAPQMVHPIRRRRWPRSGRCRAGGSRSSWSATPRTSRA